MNESQRIKIDAVKSVRPRDFARKTLVAKINENDMDRFCENAVRTVQKGTLIDIHSKMQLEEYER
jgi:hypothetical protein